MVTRSTFCLLQELAKLPASNVTFDGTGNPPACATLAVTVELHDGEGATDCDRRSVPLVEPPISPDRENRPIGLAVDFARRSAHVGAPVPLRQPLGLASLTPPPARPAMLTGELASPAPVGSGYVGLESWRRAAPLAVRESDARRLGFEAWLDEQAAGNREADRALRTPGQHGPQDAERSTPTRSTGPRGAAWYRRHRVVDGAWQETVTAPNGTVTSRWLLDEERDAAGLPEPQAGRVRA